MWASLPALWPVQPFLLASQLTTTALGTHSPDAFQGSAGGPQHEMNISLTVQ
jgi:hypothetical protein